jgi:hypothetical protein
VCPTHETVLLDFSPQRHKDTEDTKEYEGERQKDLRVESRLMSISLLWSLCLCVFVVIFGLYNPASYLGHTLSTLAILTISTWNDFNDSSLRFSRVIFRPVGRPEVGSFVVSAYAAGECAKPDVFAVNDDGPHIVIREAVLAGERPPLRG